MNAREADAFRVWAEAKRYSDTTITDAILNEVVSLAACLVWWHLADNDACEKERRRQRCAALFNAVGWSL